MKYSVEKQILAYPPGIETAHPKETVDGIDFYRFNIGSGRYVWRTRDGMLEVGKIGGTFYGKVFFRLLENVFPRVRQAMRRCVERKGMWERREIVQPFPFANPHRP